MELCSQVTDYTNKILETIQDGNTVLHTAMNTTTVDEGTENCAQL
jgi:hypothetical protein